MSRFFSTYVISTNRRRCHTRNRMLCDLGKVNQRIMELPTVKWKDDIISKLKLRTYIKFKKAFNPENNALSSINRQKRALAIQLSMGTLPIKIETWQFRNMPLEIFVSYVGWMKFKMENILVPMSNIWWFKAIIVPKGPGCVFRF